MKCDGRGSITTKPHPRSKHEQRKCPRCLGSGVDPGTPHEERNGQSRARKRPSKKGSARMVDAKGPKGRTTDVEHEDLVPAGKKRRKVDPKAVAQARGRKSRDKYKLAEDDEGNDDAILLFGKHAGKRISALAQSDDGRGYLLWMMGEDFDDTIKLILGDQLRLGEFSSRSRRFSSSRPPF